MITLYVNGHCHQLDVGPETPLLWVLNEHLGLTGTKHSCGIEECGACTVLIDGRSELSCSTPVGTVEDREIITIEGLTGPLADWSKVRFEITPVADVYKHPHKIWRTCC